MTLLLVHREPWVREAQSSFQRLLQEWARDKMPMYGEAWAQILHLAEREERFPEFLLFLKKEGEKSDEVSLFHHLNLLPQRSKSATDTMWQIAQELSYFPEVPRHEAWPYLEKYMIQAELFVTFRPLPGAIRPVEDEWPHESDRAQRELVKEGPISVADCLRIDTKLPPEWDSYSDQEWESLSKRALSWHRPVYILHEVPKSNVAKTRYLREAGDWNLTVRPWEDALWRALGLEDQENLYFQAWLPRSQQQDMIARWKEE